MPPRTAGARPWTSPRSSAGCRAVNASGTTARNKSPPVAGVSGMSGMSEAERVGCLGIEVAVDQVRDPVPAPPCRGVMNPVRRIAPAMSRRCVGRATRPAAYPGFFRAELRVDPRHAVGASGRRVNRPDASGPRVPDGERRPWLLQGSPARRGGSSHPCADAGARPPRARRSVAVAPLVDVGPGRPVPNRRGIRLELLGPLVGGASCAQRGNPVFPELGLGRLALVLLPVVLSPPRAGSPRPRIRARRDTRGSAGRAGRWPPRP